MTRLIDGLTAGLDCDLSHIRGYSDDEIRKIESFYNIKVSGDFRRFLMEIGRSSGGVLLPDLVFYSGYYAPKSPATVSGHLAEQLEFKRDLLTANRPFLSGSPFLISIEYETQYYFLRTRADEPLRGISPEDDYSQLSDDPDIVYHLDENTGIVKNTERSIQQYLKSQIQLERAGRPGAGEIISI